MNTSFTEKYAAAYYAHSEHTKITQMISDCEETLAMAQDTIEDSRIAETFYPYRSVAFLLCMIIVNGALLVNALLSGTLEAMTVRDELIAAGIALAFSCCIGGPVSVTISDYHKRYVQAKEIQERKQEQLKFLKYQLKRLETSELYKAGVSAMNELKAGSNLDSSATLEDILHVYYPCVH